MSEGTPQDGSRITWGRSTVEQRHTKTAAEIERELLPLVTTSEGPVRWKPKYQQRPMQQGYVGRAIDIVTASGNTEQARRSSCLYASTLNGARMLGINVPIGSETRLMHKPSLHRFFIEGGNYDFSTEQARQSFRDAVERQIPGSQITAGYIALRELVDRLNRGLPVVVNMPGHAVLLDKIVNREGRLEVGVLDPLTASWKSESFTDLMQHGLHIDTREGVESLPAVTIDRKQARVQWRRP